jgi:hypothetical protein
MSDNISLGNGMTINANDGYDKHVEIIEQDIATILDNMLKKVILIDEGDYPQKIKDDSKTLLNKSIDMIDKELSEQTINRLVVNEYRKKAITK